LVQICGPKSLTYFEDTNEVFKNRSPGPGSCYLTIGEWANMPGGLIGLKLGGTMQIAIDGERRDCTVVSGQSQDLLRDPFEGRGTGNLVAMNAPVLANLPVLSIGVQRTQGSRSLCIDRTGDVLWYQTERTAGGERVRETTTFSHFEYGAAVIPED